MGLYRIKFKEINNGRDGGLGSVKAFKASGNCPQDAARKLRKKARILSVRRIK